jgi:uncharacterized protein YhfF
MEQLMIDADQPAIDAYWATFLRSRADDPPARTTYLEADQFGNTPEMADRLAALVCSGVKTASSGLLWGYEATGERLPEVGDLAITLDGSGMPVCIIELTEARVLPFEAVDEQMAYEYGEGERTLAWWREHLWDYYVAQCAADGWQPARDMPLVFKRFRVVYPVA